MIRLIVDQKWIFRILRHVLLFVTMVLVFSWVIHSRSDHGSGFPADLLVILINAVIFFGYAYITVYILIPRLLTKGRFTLFIGTFLLLGIALSALKFLISDIVFCQVLSPESSFPSRSVTLATLLVNTKDMTFIVALFAIAKFARDHYILETNIRELKQKGLEAEIKLLEHHMDPHVIFNNFNNLYSISMYRPEILNTTVKQLRSVLYYLFLESKHEKVMLSKEIEMIENYIGLEELRFGDRLSISYTLEGNTGDQRIAPLILYPFVENCFVHGAGEEPRKSWIRIELSVKESNLRFYAANSVSGYKGRSRDRNKSSGIANSIRRLEIQYPNSHRLAIMDRQNEHVVELNLRLG
jgi:sensor histidine kinase YesM